MHYVFAGNAATVNPVKNICHTLESLDQSLKLALHTCKGDSTLLSSEQTEALEKIGLMADGTFTDLAARVIPVAFRQSYERDRKSKSGVKTRTTVRKYDDIKEVLKRLEEATTDRPCLNDSDDDIDLSMFPDPDASLLS